MKMKAKSILPLLLAACMLLTLAACGAGGQETGASAAQKSAEAPASEAPPAVIPVPTPEAEDAGFRTMADVFAYDLTDSSFSEELYVCVFEADGTYWRAVAELPADVSETIRALDFFDRSYDSLVREAVAPLDILRLDNLTESIPSQEELDTLAGRNVQELVDRGWYYWSWNMGEKVLGMYCGPFSYLVTFDGTPEDPESFDASQSGALTVRSVQYNGIGDATSEVLDAWNGEDLGQWTEKPIGEWTDGDFGENPDGEDSKWTGADFGELPPEDFGEYPAATSAVELSPILRLVGG